MSRSRHDVAKQPDRALVPQLGTFKPIAVLCNIDNDSANVYLIHDGTFTGPQNIAPWSNTTITGGLSFVAIEFAAPNYLKISLNGGLAGGETFDLSLLGTDSLGRAMVPTSLVVVDTSP